MQSERILSVAALAITAGIEVQILSPTLVRAQDLGGMSCEELWYARNRIYARTALLLQHRAGAIRFWTRVFSALRAIARLGEKPR
jgi:hypothetical protein